MFNSCSNNYGRQQLNPRESNMVFKCEKMFFHIYEHIAYCFHEDLVADVKINQLFNSCLCLSDKVKTCSDGWSLILQYDNE